MLKLSVCCCTYNRPHLLGELIESFQKQSYPKSHCELVVLDDAGQYGDLRGENWQVVSFPRRFASLGEKRNACVSLTSPDSEYVVMTDDDDIYLPWWLESHVKKFERGSKWNCEQWCYLSKENEIVSKMVYPAHPSHAYDRDMFVDAGGYPPISGWEDRDFHAKLRENRVPCDDSCGERSSLIYRRFSSEKHLTGVPVEAYRDSTKFAPILPRAELEIGWRRDYLGDVEHFETRSSNKEKKS
ncbi:MAG TPA: hypothetical protein DEB39_09650 [Planctomycetaceae bacterium]|nr:hypothetical protein [Planctomycetaceae bacterium]